MNRPTSGRDARLEERKVSAFVLHGIFAKYARSVEPCPNWLSELIATLSCEDGRDRRLPLGQVYALMETALARSGDPALGLHLAQSLSSSTHNVVSELVTHAQSLREALADLLRYGAIMADGMGIELHEEGDVAVLKASEAPSISEPVMHLCTELEVGGLVTMLRHFDRDAQLREVAFPYAAPAHRAEYSRFFCNTERFLRPFSGVVFERSLLDLPLGYRDHEVQGALRRVAEAKLARLGASAPYASRVRAALSESPAPHRVTMREAAARLGLSQRSLQRRLEDEGVSYRSLSREAAGERATELLGAERKTIQEVAFAMGFHSANSFHRAFKRWTGRSPGSSTE